MSTAVASVARAFGRWGVLAAALVYLVLALPQLQRPLIYDEVDFAKAARAVAAGQFRYDRGYIADYPTAPDSGHRFQLALFHPPGYLVALAAWQRLAGSTDSALRGFGVLCGLASLACAAVLGRAAGGPAAGAWAALLWATSPYALQSALLLDIDGTVLAPAVGAFAALASRSWLNATPASGYPSRAMVALAAAFAVALWCKLTTPLLVAPPLLVWLLATGKRTHAATLLAAVVAGSALFVVTWWAFASTNALPATRTFSDLWYELSDALRHDDTPGGSGGTSSALYVLVSLLRTAQWLHPLGLGMLVAAPLALRWKGPAAGLLLAAGVTIGIDLIKLAAGFPKYHAGVLPLAAAAAGTAASAWTQRQPSWPIYVAGGAVVGAAATMTAGADALIHKADLRLLAVWLAVAAACLAAARPLGAARPAAVALGLLLGANLATAAAQVTLPGSATYFYGTTGQVEAGRWLRTQLSPNVVVAADKEVAYYAAPTHFVDSERFHQVMAVTERGRDSLRPLPAPIRLFVSQHGPFMANLPAGSRLIARFGSYQVWQLGPD
jgi:hypothetical protein